VVGVEASDEMVQRATENAKANQLSQAVVLFTRFNKRLFASFLGKTRI
jgi:23S rRNA (uracil1939-C5)-methyltransferase